MKKLIEIFLTFLKLGLTSFGGPVAHLGYFHDEFVIKKKWVSETQYADLVGLCQFLPGPGSSQVGFAIGLFRGKWLGGAAAWLGFTLPSALVMIACGYGFSGNVESSGWLVGLKVVAVSVVAHAVWGMAGKLCPDRLRRLMAFLAAAVLVVIPNVWVQVGVILVGGLVGMMCLSVESKTEPASAFPWTPNWKFSTGCLIAFVTLLFLLPLIGGGGFGLKLFDSFYRSGSLVFGGGHVVLPLLESEVVSPGWVGSESFLAGYGAAQAVPGPLFTFAAYLGAAIDSPAWTAAPWVGGVLCLVAIFLPAWLLMLGVLPFWDRLRQMPKACGLLAGANAVVVGVLLAALYDPVWTKGILGASHFALALMCYFLLAIQKIPSWAVVLFGAGIGAVLF